MPNVETLRAIPGWWNPVSGWSTCSGWWAWKLPWMRTRIPRGQRPGDAPVGPAVELTVTVAGAELFEAVHPDTATAARTTAAVADVFQAVRVITCIGAVLVLVWCTEIL